MGKSFIELEWARIVCEHTALPVLLLAPLAVAKQMIQEANKFGIAAAYSKGGSHSFGIVVSNYERLGNFNAEDYSGVVLDESSILKSFDGATRSLLIETFRETPYKLCGTATLSPNDHMEIGNHAEFLGVMTATEMLSTFFVHDGGETQKWRLKGHARKEFWKWVCSWAVNIRKPSDIGYDDGPFTLPPLHLSATRSLMSDIARMLLRCPRRESFRETCCAAVDGRRSGKGAVEIVGEEPDESWILVEAT